MIILLKEKGKKGKRKKKKTKRFGANPPQTNPPPPGPLSKNKRGRGEGEGLGKWAVARVQCNFASMHPTMQISQLDGFVRAMYGKVPYGHVYIPLISPVIMVSIKPTYLPTYLRAGQRLNSLERAHRSFDFHVLVPLQSFQVTPGRNDTEKKRKRKRKDHNNTVCKKINQLLVSRCIVIYCENRQQHICAHAPSHSISTSILVDTLRQCTTDLDAVNTRENFWGNTNDARSCWDC